MLTCEARPEVHFLLELNNYNLLTEIYPSLITRKFSNCQNRLYCHLSHTRSAVKDYFTHCFIQLSHSNKCCTSESVCTVDCKLPEMPYKISSRGLLWTENAQGQPEAGSLPWKMGIPAVTSILLTLNVQNPYNFWATEVFPVFLGMSYKYNLPVTDACKYSSFKQQLFPRTGEKEQVLNGQHHGTCLKLSFSLLRAETKQTAKPKTFTCLILLKTITHRKIYW